MAELVGANLDTPQEEKEQTPAVEAAVVQPQVQETVAVEAAPPVITPPAEEVAPPPVLTEETAAPPVIPAEPAAPAAATVPEENVIRLIESAERSTTEPEFEDLSAAFVGQASADPSPDQQAA